LHFSLKNLHKSYISGGKSSKPPLDSPSHPPLSSLKGGDLKSLLILKSVLLISREETAWISLLEEGLREVAFL